MMKKYINSYRPHCIILLLIFIAFMSGCLPRLDPGPAPVRVRLTPAMPGSAGMAPSKHQLTVSTPSLLQDIDNDRIALIFHSREMRTLSGVRWSSALGEILYRSLTEALQSTEAFSGVGDELAGLASQRRLNSDITLFALEYATETEAPVARFSGTFRLLNSMEAKVIATLQIDIKVPAGSTDNAALVGALEKALEQGLAQISTWAVQNSR